MNKQLVRIFPAAVLLSFAAISVTQAAETKEQHERSTAMHAKVGLEQAIATVEKSSGGPAISGQLEYSDGLAFYEITTIAQGERRMSTVNPTTGDIIEQNKKSRGARRDDDSVKTGALARAVTSAEKAANMGKALEAEYTDTDEVARIRVELVRSDHQVQKVDVDANTGRVLKVGDVERVG